MKTNIYEQYKPLLNDWRDNIEVVREHNRSFSDVEATQLAILLENTRNEIEVACGRIRQESMMIGEGTDIHNIATQQSYVFDLITSIVPNLIAHDIVSVQPLDRRNGQVFYLKFKAGSDKGNIKKGQNLLQPNSGYAYVDYSGETITETLANKAGAVTDRNLSWTPIIPGTVKLTDGVKISVDVDNGDGTGTIGPLTGDTSPGSMGTATINYATGALTGITLTSPSVADGDIVVEWQYNLNSIEARVPEYDTTVEAEPVVARPRKLKSIYLFDVSYDLKMNFGLDMDEVILKATSGEIGFEIDREIMGDLLNIAASSSPWKKNPPYKGMDILQYNRTSIDAINKASNTILALTQRYEASYVICGKDFATVIESLGKDYFKRVTTGGIVGGPHLAGILDDKYKVYKNPGYPDNVALVGAKGELLAA